MNIFETKKMAELEFNKIVNHKDFAHLKSFSTLLEKILDIATLTTEFKFYSKSKKQIFELNKLAYLFNEYAPVVTLNKYAKQLKGWDVISIYDFIEDILNKNISIQEKIKLIDKRCA